MSQYGWHNSPTEVRRQVDRVVDGVRRHLAENLVGVYLHGSLATGCFNPLRSDIDLLVVTKHGIAISVKHDLARFLLNISLSPGPIEISFLQQSDLVPWRYPTSFDLHYSEDWRERFELELRNDESKEWNAGERFDDDLAAHITVLNHRGRCLYGRAIEEVFPMVPGQDYVRSILGDVLSETFGLGALHHYPVYVVLNSCRTLAFLKTGRVLSKDEGGVWALENLSAEFRPVIMESLEEYRSGPNESELATEPLDDFAQFMKNELELHSRQWLVD